MRPEYNDKMKLVSMMAPFSYMDHVGFPLNMILKFFDHLLHFKNWEFLPNSPKQRKMVQTVCHVNNGSICNRLINLVLGPSRDQRNDVC